MSKTVTVTEVNERFPEIFDQILEGESFIVTSQGRPAVRMERIDLDASEHGQVITRLRNPQGEEMPSSTPPELANDATREEDHQKFMSYLRTLPALNIGPWTRDELYDDDLELGE